MALTTLQVQQLYLGYYGRPADPVGLAFWQAQTLEAAKAGFAASAEFTNQYAGMTVAQQVAQVYVNLLGREADVNGLLYWSNEIVSGRETIGTLVMSIQANALGRDVTTLQMRTAYSEAFTAALDTTGEVVGYSGQAAAEAARAAMANIVAASTGDTSTLTAALASLDTTVAEVVAGGGVAGQTFMLTKDFDLVTGTNGNDTIRGTVVAVPAESTLNALDEINGGAGTDTLKIADSAGAAITLPIMSSVEVVELTSTATANIDTSAYADVTHLNVVRAQAVIAKAAATTDISVSGATDDIAVDGGNNITVTDATAGNDITIGANTVNAGNVSVTDTDQGTGTITVTADAGNVTVTSGKQGTGNIYVDGGTDVSITATSSTASGTIEVGGESASAAGTVTIVQNLNDDGTGYTAEDIGVLGGTKVNIAVNATSTATKAGQNGDIDTGEINVLGDGNTTEVTVKQTASVTTFTTPVVAEVKAQTVVTFAALAKGDSVTVNGLTFTASKALTAEQVAAAFGNLGASDTQDKGGATANGIYSGANSAVAAWTSGAASGSTVTYTAAGGTNDTLDVGTASKVYTAGSAQSGGAKTTNNVVFNDVDIDDDVAAAAITTISIDGFADAYLGNTSADGVGTAFLAAAKGGLDKLTSLSVANGGDVWLSTASTTLALKLNNIDGAVDLDDGVAAVETLTITTEGVASDIGLTAEAVKSLTIDAGVGLTLQDGTDYDGALETVTIKGAGAVDLDDISAASKLKSFNASANTGGVTAEVSADASKLDAAFTKYVFSKGNDVVTLADVAVNKAIELGDGNDSIALATGVRIADVTATIDGGAGTNTLVLTADDAEALSATDAFNAQIDKFQRLTIGAAAGQEVVNLDNIDGISYVKLGTAAGTQQVSTITPANVEIDDVFTVTVNGNEYSFTATAATAQNVVDGLVALINGKDPSVGAANSADTLVLTAIIAGVPFTATAGATDGGGATTQTNTLAATTPNAYGITLDNLANNGTVVLTDTGSVLVNVKDADTGTADVLNLITQGAAKNVGYLQADAVETINISASDAASAGIDKQTLVLAADAATKVVVGGDGALDLTLFHTSDKVETVNASANKGGLTFTASLDGLVVTGGSGADKLTANADDVKLYGGAGNDTLTVESGLRVNLYGDAGKDTFVISAGASTTLDAYTVINGVDSGDVIKMTGASAFTSTKIALSLGADETLLNYANQAVKTLAEGEMGWFQRGGNTYIVQDVAHVPSGGSTNSDAFTAGEDMVIMITGLVDLGTASYNTSNILEIA